MSISPLPAPRRPAAAGRRLPTVRSIRPRVTLSPAALARRRFAVNLAKRLLPVAALALLAAVALWPEFDAARDQARVSFRRMAGEVGGARVTDARYRGEDEHGRPYTVTAAVARQVDETRIDLTTPKGDIALQGGAWLMVQSRQGVFIQGANQLDLSQDVTLYRDDGTTLRTASASIDLKAGAAAGSDPVSAEGPFGTLDAQGFTVTDSGAVIQFSGPARLVLDGASP